MGQQSSGDTGLFQQTSCRGLRPTAARTPSSFPSHLHRLALAWALVLATAAALLPGCVVVKPYQREQLAERCMAPGFGDPSELKFRSHWESSRQGGEGGFGTAGGGCGCN